MAWVAVLRLGYYTFTALAQDKAGNKSEQIVRTTVNDTDAPELGLIVGGYDKGAWSLTATLTDNLSLKAYWAEAFDEVDLVTAVAMNGIRTITSTSVLILPQEGGMAVDEYNSPDLTQSYLNTFTMQGFQALQPQQGNNGDNLAVGTHETFDNPSDPVAVGDRAAASLRKIQVVGVDHGAVTVDESTTGAGRVGYDIAESGSPLLTEATATQLARFGLGLHRTLPMPAPSIGGQEAQEAAAKLWNDNEYEVDATTNAKTRYKRDEVFQRFVVIDDESDEEALELRATIMGRDTYKMAVAGVEAVPATNGNPGVPGTAGTAGVEGLVNNPVSRVDFYAAVELDDISSGGGTPAGADKVPPKPDGDGTDALVFLGSSNAAGAEDGKCDHDGDRADVDNTDSGATAPRSCRMYTWGLDMSGADFLEITGGDGGENYTIVAIAVNPAGVAISASTMTEVDD